MNLSFPVQAEMVLLKNLSDYEYYETYQNDFRIMNGYKPPIRPWEAHIKNYYSETEGSRCTGSLINKR